MRNKIWNIAKPNGFFFPSIPVHPSKRFSGKASAEDSFGESELNDLLNNIVKVAFDQFKPEDYSGVIKKLSKRGANYYPKDNISTISLPQIIADFGTVSYPNHKFLQAS